MRFDRSSGILLHPTSLPGAYGIGDLGPEAYRFIDWLAEAGQLWWQVLPLGPTGYGDSPYASLSSFAGNELLLSPELLARDGLLSRYELAELVEVAEPVEAAGDRVNFGRVAPLKRKVARLAAARFVRDAGPDSRAALEAFRVEHVRWLGDYALFTSIKEENDATAARAGIPDSCWNRWWPRELARRDPTALDAWRDGHADVVAAVEAAQFLFFRQWNEVRRRAAAVGVRVMGDLPLFVAMDSADAWARPDLFMLDADLSPTEVAGVPPDYFAADGQRWGNPLYAWEAHEAEGFDWWLARLRGCLELYDAVRIDHFRGLEAFWAVPAAEPTARRGTWRKAPGHALLTAAREGLGDLPVVAEDLGFITDEVLALRDGFGLPGMRILQFAFDARESGGAFDPGNAFLPHNYAPNSVVYTGTHDNDTLAGWLAGASPAELAYLESYLGHRPANAVDALVREAMKSVAALAVIPMQDVLRLGTEARMNLPGTTGGNWAWRMLAGATDAGSAARLRSLAELYGRAKARTND